MKVKVDGRTVNVSDEVADLYAKYLSPLTDDAVEFLLQLDGIDIASLSDADLEKKQMKHC